MLTAQCLVNFICTGVALLFLTMPMYAIRRRAFEAQGVRIGMQGSFVIFALLFMALWIIVSVTGERSLQAVLYALFLGTLLWMAEIDARCQVLPDACNLMIFAISIVRQILLPQGSVWSGLLGCVVISVPMFLLCLLMRGTFGGGDIKLTFAWGFFLGWERSLLAFFVALLFGSVYAIYLLLTGKKERKDHFAFGPFLCIGAAITVLWGDTLLAKIYI